MWPMVVDEIKEKIDDLTPEERHEVSVYLTRKQVEEDEGFWTEIRETMADKNPEKWVNIKDVE